MSGRGRTRGAMRGGGGDRRGGGRGIQISDSIRPPSSTTSMTLHERFSTVKPKSPGRGQGQSNAGGESLGGSKKSQQLVARLQARAEKRGGGGRGGRGLNRRGRGAGLGPNTAIIQRAKMIAAARESDDVRSSARGVGTRRGRGLLRGLAARAMGQGRGGVGRGRGLTANRRGAAGGGRGGLVRGAGAGRGRGGVPAKRGRGAPNSSNAGPTRLRRPGEGAGRGRGGRAGGRGRGGGAAATSFSREQLDQEMEQYMAESKVNVISFD